MQNEWTANETYNNNISAFSNNTQNDNITSLPDPIEDKAIQAAFCTAYTIIFVVGIFGNALVCYAVIRNRAMQTVTNLFITNLALSDILLCVFAVPFTPLYTFLGRWVFGGLLCHIMPYAQGCSVYISTLTLTSIAIDRFFVIIYPFKPRMKIKTCIGLIVFIWVFALSVTFPYGYYMALQDVFCAEKWPSDQIRKAFGAVTTIMQFVIPFIVMAFCYTCVSIKLNDRLKSRPGSKNSKKEDAERERKRRTNRMLIAMVAIFGLSWLPLNLINISSDFYSFAEDWRYYMVLFFIAHFIAMSSTCYNPFLYAWLNENFRKEFKQILPCLGAFVTKKTRKNFNQSERTGMYRSEKTCNGNDTIQESLLTSTVTKPSVRYKIEFNEKLKVYEDDGENISPDEKPEEKPSPNEDCVKMYMFVNKSAATSDKEPIVSAL
ncbi:prolactin-releasing peptide receptor-like [Nymphalis io]|uniref:prolactin-releasing peptide receptor-like n=1 Tax=Inachis io TaxID=171585 RepID=UPI00216A9F7E|nr:prolactin-releasing peptide receptor-like [Nymphalis io]XP_050351989.1 prolactin-releasing peptide receptor-like [Nymphalis io]